MGYIEYLSAYNDFLITEMAMQDHMMNCINEAIAIAEGTTYVHEGVITAGIKNIWNKFVTFINKIFAKFKETFNRIDPKGYLEKYAGVITKQPLKFKELSMVTYDLTAISKCHAEHFDPAKIDVYKQGNAAYLKTIDPFTGYNGANETEDINNYIKLQLCGGKTSDEVSIVPASLNMTDLYTFCHDFKDKTQKDLDKDQDSIITSSNAFEKLLKEIEAAEKAAAADATESKKAEAAADGKPAPETGTGGTEQQTPIGAQKRELGGGNGTPVYNASTSARTGGGTATAASIKAGPRNAGNPPTYKGNSESAIISLDKSFKALSELKIGTGAIGDNGGAPQVATNTKFSRNAAGLTGQETNKDAVQAAIKTAGGYTPEDIKAAIDTYRTVNGAICSIKLSLCQAAYKDYMQIIKTHVRSYVGEQQRAGGVAQGGTDYSQGQPQQQTTQQQNGQK